MRSPSPDDAEKHGARSNEEVAGGVRKGQVNSAALLIHGLGHVGRHEEWQMPRELVLDRPLQLLLERGDCGATIYILELG